MGSKGGGQSSSGSNFGFSSGTSTYTPNPQAMAAYEQSLGMAQSAVSRPYTPYQGQMVAGFTPDQMSAMQGVRNMQGMVQPYINTATNLTQQAVDFSDPRNFSQNALNQYMNPYQQSVVNATMNQLAQQQAQAYQQANSQAGNRGTFGGSGQYLGQAEVARQQGLANAQTLAQLNAGNYQQAQNQYNQQQQQAIQTAQNAAYGLGQLGNMSQASALTGINALLQSGGMQQQLAQQQLTGAYNQFLQELAYPYQQAAFYSGIAAGIGPSMGGTTTYSGINMGQNQSQSSGGGGGGGMGGIGSVMSMLPAMFSDEREKTDKKKLGKDPETGLDMYAYRYKGDPKSYPKVVGPMAQDVEEKYPGFVFDVADRKAVAEPERFMPRAAGGASSASSGASAQGQQASGQQTSGQQASGSKAADVYAAPDSSYTSASLTSSPGAASSEGSSAQAEAIDPGTAQFLKGFLDPQTADQIARSKWVSKGTNTRTAPEDSFGYFSELARADGGRIHYAHGGFGELPAQVNPNPLGGVSPIGANTLDPKPSAGSLGDMISDTKLMFGANPIDSPMGSFSLAATPSASMAPSNLPAQAEKLAKQAVPPKAASTEHFSAAGAKQAQAGAEQASKSSGKGGGGGGSGGGGGGMPKMPSMKGQGSQAAVDKQAGGNERGVPAEDSPKTETQAPQEQQQQNQPESQAQDSKVIEPNEPVAQDTAADAGAGEGGGDFGDMGDMGGDMGGMDAAPEAGDMGGGADAGGMGGGMEDILGGFGGFFSGGGRIKKAGGGAGGAGAGGAGGFGGQGVIGSLGGSGGDTGGPSDIAPFGGEGPLGPQLTLGESVLGKGGLSPSRSAGFGNLKGSQQKFTGDNLVGDWMNQYRADYKGGPQLSPEQQGMPSMPGQDWYSKNLNVSDLSIGSDGTPNPGGISYSPVMTGMSSGSGMMMAPMFSPPTNGSDYNSTAKMFKASPTSTYKGNPVVEGYYTGLASNQVNPDTGLFNVNYLSPYYGAFYKDGGRVKMQRGGRRPAPPSQEEMGKHFGALEQKYNLPQGFMQGMAGIESRGGTMADRAGSQFKGMFQLGSPIRKQFGVTNPSDWRQSAEGAAKYAQQNSAYLNKQLGRAPTAGELYAAHQQGPAGAAALIKHPDMPANRALSTLGKSMPMSTATRNISGNLPQSMRGSMPTANKFLQAYNSRFQQPAGQPDTRMAAAQQQQSQQAQKPQDVAMASDRPPQGSVLNQINPKDPSGPLMAAATPASASPQTAGSATTPQAQAWSPPAEIADRSQPTQPSQGTTPQAMMADSGGSPGAQAVPQSPGPSLDQGEGQAPAPMQAPAPAGPMQQAGGEDETPNIEMASAEDNTPDMGDVGGDSGGDIEMAASGGRIHKRYGGDFDIYHPKINRIANAIAGIESSGHKNPYAITGVRDRHGDLPYGKYQIMGRNIPKWGAEAGYKGLTIDEFRRNPQIQEDIARHQFAKILDKSGQPSAVAGEWLGGPGWKTNKSADALGTTVPQYMKRFASLYNREGSDQIPSMVAANFPPAGSSFVSNAAYSPVAYRPGENRMGIIPRIIKEIVGPGTAEAAEVAPVTKASAPARRMSYEEAGRPDMSQMTDSEIAEANGKRGWGDFARPAQGSNLNRINPADPSGPLLPVASDTAGMLRNNPPNIDAVPLNGEGAPQAPASKSRFAMPKFSMPKLRNFQTNDLPTALGMKAGKSEQQVAQGFDPNAMNSGERYSPLAPSPGDQFNPDKGYIFTPRTQAGFVNEMEGMGPTENVDQLVRNRGEQQTPAGLFTDITGEQPYTPTSQKREAEPVAADRASAQKGYGDWRDQEPWKSDPIGGMFDSLTGDAPQSESNSDKQEGFEFPDFGFASGGKIRHGYATDGEVKEIPSEMLSTEGSPALMRQEDRAPVQEAETETRPVASDRVRGSVKMDPDQGMLRYADQPQQSEQGFGGLFGKEGADFYERWRTNPLSQLLYHAGMHMMQHGNRYPWQSAAAGMSGAMEALGEARARYAKEAEAAANAAYAKQLGYAQGGTVRKGYEDGGAPDFLGDLGNLLSPEDVSEAQAVTSPRQSATEQDQGLFGGLFGGDESQTPAPERAAPVAQREAPGLFGDLFGGEEPVQREAAPTPRAAPQERGFLEELFGVTPAEAEEAQPRVARPTAAPAVEEKAPAPGVVAPVSEDREPVTGGVEPALEKAPHLGAGRFEAEPAREQVRTEEPPVGNKGPSSIANDPIIQAAQSRIHDAIYNKPPQNSFQAQQQRAFISAQKDIIKERKDEIRYETSGSIGKIKDTEGNEIPIWTSGPRAGQPVQLSTTPGAPKAEGPDWSKTGEDFIKTLPEKDQDYVRGIIKGDLDVPKGFRQADIVKYAAHADPTFSPRVMESRRQTFKEYQGTAPTKAGGQIIAGNAAYGHAGELARLSVKVGGYPSWVLNTPINKVKEMMGAQVANDINAYNAALDKYVDEQTKLYKGTAGGVEERKEARERYNINRGPKQILAALEQDQRMMAGKLHPLEERYHAVMGRGAEYPPEVKSELETIGPSAKRGRQMLEKAYKQVYGKQPDFGEDTDYTARPKAPEIPEGHTVDDIRKELERRKAGNG